MSVMEIQRVGDLLAEDFDLDLQITVMPDGGRTGDPRMDGGTTYATGACVGSCDGSCQPGLSVGDTDCG
jgi:hypothetical protein